MVVLEMGVRDQAVEIHTPQFILREYNHVIAVHLANQRLGTVSERRNLTKRMRASCLQHLYELQKDARRALGIIHRAVVILQGHPERLCDRIEFIAVQLRQEHVRETHRVQDGWRVVKPLCVCVLADKAGVKGRIVRDHGGIAAKREKVRQHSFNRRCVPHHRVIDAGELLDAVGNRQFRIYKFRETVHDFTVLYLDRADLYDTVFSRREAGGLNVEDHEAVIKRALTGRNHEFF